jgi:hypothetical protein
MTRDRTEDAISRASDWSPNSAPVRRFGNSDGDGDGDGDGRRSGHERHERVDML